MSGNLESSFLLLRTAAHQSKRICSWGCFDKCQVIVSLRGQLFSANLVQIGINYKISVIILFLLDLIYLWYNEFSKLQ